MLFRNQVERNMDPGSCNVIFIFGCREMVKRGGGRFGPLSELLFLKLNKKGPNMF